LHIAKQTLNLEVLRRRPHTMWRYEEVLPGAPPITLGEGMTPLIHAERLGVQLHVVDDGAVDVEDDGLRVKG